MIEQEGQPQALEKPETNGQIHILDQYARFYFNRLTDSLNAVDILDKEFFPVNFYQAEEDGISVPIYPQEKWPHEKGLRFGLLHAITGYFQILEEMGYGQEAKAILEFKGAK